MTESAIHSRPARDLYVALGEPLEGGRAWSLRVHHKPMVVWIWLGCLVMAAGALLAIADRRYRIAVRRRAPAPRDAGAAAEAAR